MVSSLGYLLIVTGDVRSRASMLRLSLFYAKYPAAMLVRTCVEWRCFGSVTLTPVLSGSLILCTAGTSDSDVLSCCVCFTS